MASAMDQALDEMRALYQWVDVSAIPVATRHLPECADIVSVFRAHQEKLGEIANILKAGLKARHD